MFRFAGFELDPLRASLRATDGEAIRLRPKSFDMLQMFVANAGRVISKQELIDAIWPNIHVADDGLFQCIREIRIALADEQRQLIKLVSGRGYLFDAEVSAAPADRTKPVEGVGASAPAIEPRRLADEASQQAGPAVDQVDPLERKSAWPRARALTRGRWRLRFALAAMVVLGAAIGLTTARFIFKPASISTQARPVITVMPITGMSDDPQTVQMAAGLAERLSDGLSRVGNIRVVSLGVGVTFGAMDTAAGRDAQASFVVTGQLWKSASSWDLQARMVEAGTGELLWSTSFSVGAEDGDLLRQQYRLAGGLGYPLALRVNKLLNGETRQASTAGAAESAGGNAAFVIEQARAFLDHATPERYQAAEAMLEQALAREPDNADLQVALATHRLRGLQTDWYPEADRSRMEAGAEAMLLATLREKSTYLPALGAYCRFLTATNRFAESLVTCAKALSFDPWDGTALFQTGLSLMQLGRFEDALASFLQADQFDTPQVSRWTWLLGAGLACLYLDRDEDAVNWMTRSIAITPGTGRSYFILAAAYRRLGRQQEAKLALAKGMEIRPGSTVQNVGLPVKNTSPVYLKARDKVSRTLIELGLPES
ncbi:DNA-binding winged helix-turn-helix (wHTH) domain-containing protein [Rhizobiales bacterium GAS188]|nr:DNA-binding winged helix-turn-helix (wHTH) domain-containing protein [Rhizobiales bacterium GAS188]